MTRRSEETVSDAQDSIPPHRIGRDGRLFLRLRQADGRTVVAEQRCEPPLAIQRALYCEYTLPEMAYLYVASTSGGILQGDRQMICIELEEATKAHATTQGATRIYGIDPRTKDGAAQVHRITLAQDAYLEYVPDQIIPYAGSRFSQSTEITMHKTSTLVYAETVAPGRVGMGESFAYESCSLKIRITDDKGRLRYADAADMSPRDSTRSEMRAFGVMNRYKVVSSVYILTDGRHIAKIYDDIYKVVQPPTRPDTQSAGTPAATIGGATLIGDKTGILIRLLGDDSESVKFVVDDVIKHVRRQILDAAFTKVRKG